MKKYYKQRKWIVICRKWLGWKEFGMRVDKGRPEKGKYISPDKFPDDVRSSFDMGWYYPDIGETDFYCPNTKTRLPITHLAYNCIQSFKDESCIEEYRMIGAKVTNLNGLQYKIEFTIEHERIPKSIKRVANAHNMPRSKWGTFMRVEE